MQTFTAETFTTLDFVEVLDVGFELAAAASPPPPPPPPSYPGGKWPLEFTVIMKYGESGSSLNVRDARDSFVRVLMNSTGEGFIIARP
jgi:hypothetical protein